MNITLIHVGQLIIRLYKNKKIIDFPESLGIIKLTKS